MKLTKKKSEKLLEELKIYRQEGTKIHAVIGHFIFSFQEVCESIKTCIYKGLSNNGLSDTVLAKNIVEHNTANQLIESFRSFYCDFNNKDENGKKIINKFLNRFSKINKIRNDIVHGNLNVCYINNKGVTVAYASGQKMKVTKNGIKNVLSENHLDGKNYQIGYYNENYFKLLVTELSQLRAYFSYFGLYLEKKINIGDDIKDEHYISWQQFNIERDNYINTI